jgi:hypothetical protein
LDDGTLDSKLFEIEQANIAKFGPRSIAKPWLERKASLEEYFGKSEPEALDPKVYSGNGHLRPYTFETVKRNHLINTSNSGLPILKKKSLVKENYSKEQWIDELLEPGYNMPCVLFTRTQEGGKTRNVWGYPLCATILEQMYFQPYLKYVESQRFNRSALRGPDFVDEAMTQLINAAKFQKSRIICVDFTAFDANVSTELIHRAVSTIASHFQYGADAWQDGDGGSIHALQRVLSDLTSIGICTPDGLWYGNHGVPSGSTFTNSVDSLCQLFAAGLPVDDRLCQVQGDDGVYTNIDKDELYDRFNNAGFKINEEKSYVDDERAVYLQRFYSPMYRDRRGTYLGVYSIARAFNRIVFQERFQDFDSIDISGRDYYNLRTVSILENCKHHPKFQGFVTFVAKKMPDLLDWTASGLRSFAKEVARRSGGLNNQYSDMVTGINNFETVRLLRSN